MNNYFKFLVKGVAIASSIFLFTFTSVFGNENRLCMDNEGFIYPVFEKNCEKTSDVSITLNEFRHIKEFAKKDRLKELKKFKLQVKDNKIEKNLNKEEVNSLAKEIKEKSQIKASFAEKRLKAEKAREERKKEFLAKKLERKKVQEQKQFERKKLQEQRKRELLAKQEERKKLQEQRKRELLAKQEERKRELLAKQEERKRLQEIKRQERVAKQEEKKRLQASKNQQSLVKKEKNKVIKKEETKPLIINETLKIVLFNKEIVKKELFPNIDTSENIDFENINQLDKAKLDELLKINKKLIVIIPNDYESFSNQASENKMMSQYVSGISQVPNPKINGLEAQLRRAEREMIVAERNIQAGLQQNLSSYDPYGGWASLLNQMGGLATQMAAEKKLNQAVSNYEYATRELTNTPMYLERELLSSYSYKVSNIKSEKKAIYDILQSIDGKYYSAQVKVSEENTFAVASGINPKDKNYRSLNKKYNTIDSVRNWENKKIKNISVAQLLTQVDSSEKSTVRKKDFYSTLNLKSGGDSWFENLFGKKKNKTKKIASLNKNNNFSVNDERFDSVVVVRADNGLGSGFYISSDEIITNYHVIEDAKSIFIIDRNKNKSSAAVIKKDMKRDLALLKTNSKGKAVKFFNGQIKQGAMVEALGHPKGRKFSLTKGWVSAIRKESSVYNVSGKDNVLFIQTDAAINKGNSGGPLFMENRVVGVNTQGLSKERTEGMNFAVHFSEVQDFLNK